MISRGREKIILRPVSKAIENRVFMYDLHLIRREREKNNNIISLKSNVAYEFYSFFQIDFILFDLFISILRVFHMECVSCVCWDDSMHLMVFPIFLKNVTTNTNCNPHMVQHEIRSCFVTAYGKCTIYRTNTYIVSIWNRKWNIQRLPMLLLLSLLLHARNNRIWWNFPN